MIPEPEVLPGLTNCSGSAEDDTEVIETEYSGTESESLGNENTQNSVVCYSDNTLNGRVSREPSYLKIVTNCEDFDQMQVVIKTEPESENEVEFDNNENSHNVAIFSCDKTLQNNLSTEAVNSQSMTNLKDSAKLDTIDIKTEMDNNTSAVFYRTEDNQSGAVAYSNNTDRLTCEADGVPSPNSEHSTQEDNFVIKMETDIDNILEFYGTDGAKTISPDESIHFDNPKGHSFSCLREDLHSLPKPFILNYHSDDIEVLSVISEDEKTYINLKILVKPSGHTSIYVHGKKISDAHPLWDFLPKLFTTKEDILCLLGVLSRLQVCTGNPDIQFTELIPVDTGIWHPDTGVIAYHENNFNAVYKSTIRSVSCELLSLKTRCQYCSKYRKCLRNKRDRNDKLLASDIDFTKSTYKHADMPREILVKKIQQQKDQITSLQNNINKLERQIKRYEGIQQENKDHTATKDLMELSERVSEFFQDPNSFQRLFWCEQLKAIQTNKFGMRWDPLIINWCLTIRQKSQSAYDALRNGGFVSLPSNRTLTDYLSEPKPNPELSCSDVKDESGGEKRL